MKRLIRKRIKMTEDDEMFLSIKMPSEGLWYEIIWGSVTGFYNKSEYLRKEVSSAKQSEMVLSQIRWELLEKLCGGRMETALWTDRWGEGRGGAGVKEKFVMKVQIIEIDHREWKQRDKRGFGRGLSDGHFVHLQSRKTTPKLPLRGTPTLVTLQCTLTFSLAVE